MYAVQRRTVQNVKFHFQYFTDTRVTVLIGDALDGPAVFKQFVP